MGSSQILNLWKSAGTFHCEKYSPHHSMRAAEESGETVQNGEGQKGKYGASNSFQGEIAEAECNLYSDRMS